MIKYRDMVQKITSSFQKFHISKIPRAENQDADLLSKLASSDVEIKGPVNSEYLAVKTNDCRPADKLMDIDVEPCWIDPILNYLQDGNLPSDPKEARRVVTRSSRYTIVKGQLYKKSYTLSLLKCLHPSESEFVLREIHEGITGDHLGGKALSYKVLRKGYYWPTLNKDAVDFVKRCDACQRYSNIQRPQQPP